MYIIRQITKALIPAALLLIPALSSAEVVRPALDIQMTDGDAGAWLTQLSPSEFEFDVDATAIAIVFDTPTPATDIADQAFTLHGTFDGAGFFAGTFDVAGGLLSGSFTNLVLLQLPSGSLDFKADLTYDTGSLMGGLSGGRLEGIGNDSNLSAKLGPITPVPVPAAIWLFGTGLIGLAGIARRKA